MSDIWGIKGGGCTFQILPLVLLLCTFCVALVASPWPACPFACTVFSPFTHLFIMYPAFLAAFPLAVCPLAQLSACQVSEAQGVGRVDRQGKQMSAPCAVATMLFHSINCICHQKGGCTFSDTASQLCLPPPPVFLKTFYIFL